MVERESHSHDVEGGRGHWWTDAADLTHAVILAADGGLMDGGHRIARAYLLGRRTVPARRFPITPDPDWIVAPDPG